MTRAQSACARFINCADDEMVLVPSTTVAREHSCPTPSRSLMLMPSKFNAARSSWHRQLKATLRCAQ